MTRAREQWSMCRGARMPRSRPRCGDPGGPVPPAPSETSLNSSSGLQPRIRLRQGFARGPGQAGGHHRRASTNRRLEAEFGVSADPLSSDSRLSARRRRHSGSQSAAESRACFTVHGICRKCYKCPDARAFMDRAATANATGEKQRHVLPVRGPCRGPALGRSPCGGEELVRRGRRTCGSDGDPRLHRPAPGGGGARARPGRSRHRRALPGASSPSPEASTSSSSCTATRPALHPTRPCPRTSPGRCSIPSTTRRVPFPTAPSCRAKRPS